MGGKGLPHGKKPQEWRANVDSAQLPSSFCQPLGAGGADKRDETQRTRAGQRGILESSVKQRRQERRWLRFVGP
jgi:hypothetical protein